MEPYESSADQSPQPEQTSETERRHFESFSDAVRAAKEDACDKAREAAPKVKSAFVDAVHDLAYGGAYGAVFLGAFATELVPESIREGLAKGAKAGREKARQACDKVRETVTPKKSEPSTEEVVIDLDGGGAPAGA